MIASSTVVIFGLLIRKSESLVVSSLISTLKVSLFLYSTTCICFFCCSVSARNDQTGIPPIPLKSMLPFYFLTNLCVKLSCLYKYAKDIISCGPSLQFKSPKLKLGNLILTSLLISAWVQFPNPVFIQQLFQSISFSEKGELLKLQIVFNASARSVWKARGSLVKVSLRLVQARHIAPAQTILPAFV